LKYEKYIEKEEGLAVRVNKLENMHIRTDFDYDSITALSNEAKEKLKAILPQTIGQATRISGVSPADISILMVFLEKFSASDNEVELV
jgi:tRNA uridine 5-carboxymethylaminomethyl modification enzyme